ncbi:MAG: PorV/PorQ family protein [Elusimicrobia bacterium]|nr:PorV/PorQ family protein [Elusimicrobiota bacterium]
MKKIIISLITICCFVSGIADAKSAGTAGANFLTIGIGARPMAMAGAFTGLADDVNSIFWNPAGLALLDRNEATLMHDEMGEGIRYEFLGYAHPFPELNGTLAGSISYLNISEIQGYSSGGVKTDEIKANDYSMSMAYSREIIPKLSGGINLKYIRERLEDENASTQAVDLGLLYLSPWGVGLGLSMQNIGPGLEFISEKDPLPRNLKIGTAYRLGLLGNRLIISADGNFPYDENRYICAGMEYMIFDLIGLRVGYRSEDDLENGLRFGLGLASKNLSFDYAFLPRGDFQDSHRISLTLRYGKVYEYGIAERDIDEHLKKGEKYFHQGELLKAYREFNSIVSVCPGHKDAQDYMAKVRLKIEESDMNRLISGHFTKGKQLYQKGELIRAKEEFESILNISPEHNEAMDYISRIDGRFEEVAGSIFAKGVSDFEEGNYDTAIREMERVLTFNPEHSQAQEYVSLIKEKQRKIEEIKRKQRAETCFNTGVIYYKRNKWSKAQSQFEEALEIDPENKDASAYLIKTKEKIAGEYYEQAMKFYEKKDFKTAISKFKDVLKFTPDHTKAKSYLAEATKTLKEINRKEAETCNNEALKEYTSGRIKKAVELWEKALRLDPELTDAQVNLERAKKELK